MYVKIFELSTQTVLFWVKTYSVEKDTGGYPRISAKGGELQLCGGKGK